MLLQALAGCHGYKKRIIYKFIYSLLAFMSDLQHFASFLLAHHLDQMTSIYIQRARETRLKLLDNFSHLSEEQLFDFIKKYTVELLQNMIDGTARQLATYNIALWHEDKIPGIHRDQPGLHDLVQTISIRKYSFIKLISVYTRDVDKYTAVLLELNEFYDFYREKAYETYISIQHESLVQEKNFIQTILDTTTEGISALDTALRVTSWNNALVKRTGVKKEDILGKYIFDFFPQNAVGTEYESIQKALGGEKVKLENVPIRSREGFYDMEVIPLRDQEGNIMGSLSISRDVTEKKRTAEKLEQALNYYLTILDDFPALIWRANTEAKCDYFNKTWLTFTGRTLEQEYGDGWAQGVHPEDLQRCMDIFFNSFHARQPFDMEYRLRRHDGTYRWVLDIAKPVYDLNRTFIGYLGTCFDIQDRKDAEQDIYNTNLELNAALEELRSAEEKLRETNLELERKVEERTRALAANEEELKQMLDKSLELNQTLAEREHFLSSILDQTPVSTWIANAEGTQIRVNEACLKLFGVEEASLGLGKYNVLKDNTLQDKSFFKDIQAVFTEGKVAKFSGEYNLSHVKHVDVRTGKNIHLVTTIFPVKNTKGEITHAVVQHEDITERVHSEKALRASEEQLRLITDALPVLISYIDTNEVYRFVNKAYTVWFNKSKEEILNKPVKALVGQTAYDTIIPSVRKALMGEEAHFEGRMTYQNVPARYTSASFVPHFEEGKTVGCFALVFDISSLKEHQEQLVQTNEELIRINNDLDNFIYAASHDLKSPIVNLEGLISTINRTLQTKLDEREQKLFSMMDVSIKKLKSTISYLSDVAKITKNPEENTETIHIPALVEDVKADIEHLIQQAQPTITEAFHVTDINFVKENLKSIVYNLLSNAIKYRSPKRPLSIKMSTYEEDKFVVFSMQDNGLGMEPSQQSKLFNLFKRLHTHVEGTGIGLYIIKRIIENTGGKIMVESATDKGSTFKVYLPKTLKKG